MSKKLILLAAGALTILAFAALPSIASAGTWNCETSAGAICGTFDGNNTTVTKLTFHESTESIECRETTIHGEYKTKTTGENLTLTFHECESPAFGGECHSSGQASGVIKTFDLDFDNILIDAGTPGLLITPNTANHEFMTFVCAGIVTVHLTGNGVIGDLTRSCNSEVAAGVTSTLDFESIAPGTQKYMQITTTGTKYDMSLIKTFFGTTTKTASLDAALSMTFPGSKTKVAC